MTAGSRRPCFRTRASQSSKASNSTLLMMPNLRRRKPRHGHRMRSRSSATALPASAQRQVGSLLLEQLLRALACGSCSGAFRGSGSTQALGQRSSRSSPLPPVHFGSVARRNRPSGSLIAQPHHWPGRDQSAFCSTGTVCVRGSIRQLIARRRQSHLVLRGPPSWQLQ